ncbi:MAG TPA: glycosyltransferase [Fibrobacteria bacterium]|nr:glycosyltransferase [Fibrobacteria bacterium]
MPTYNRTQKALARIEEAVEQIGSRKDVQILVLDNQSPEDVELAYREKHPDAPGYISFRKNRVNIGGNGNIARCFEYCETEWMWLISDDDKLKANAVDTIFSAIQRNSNSIWINFKDPEWLGDRRYEEERYHGVNDLCKLDHFGNALLISNSVFNIGCCRKSVWLGIQYAFTNAPHLAIAWSAIGKSGDWVLSPASVVHRTIPEKGDTFQHLVVALGLLHIGELPVLNANKMRFVKHFARINDDFFSPKPLFINALRAWKLGVSERPFRRMKSGWQLLGSPLSPGWLFYLVLSAFPSIVSSLPFIRAKMDLSSLQRQIARG